MNPSICINNVSPLYSDYSVVCVLYRLIQCDAFEKVYAVNQKDKRGNVYQKIIVDFKQDIQTDELTRFYCKILRDKRISSEVRQHYWKVHFVPRPRIAQVPQVVPVVKVNANAAAEAEA